MQIGGVNFRKHVFGQSGVEGFFGEGDEYFHHRVFKILFYFWFTFRGMVFVAKTGTMNARIFPKDSNTELKEGYKLKRWFPKSVWWSLKSFRKGYLLNAIGLANPGITWLLLEGKWQSRKGPLMLSFMPMESTLEGKLEEVRKFCIMFNAYTLQEFRKRCGIQVNLSCPNTGHDQKQDASEAAAILRLFKELLPGVPIVPKFDLTVEPKSIAELQYYCDAFMISNALAFGKEEKKVKWNELFKNGISPLAGIFGPNAKGGLSGAPLFPLLVEWLERMQEHDPHVKIIAGGGIMKKADIKRLSEFSVVEGVALGSVAILRPWRMRGLIKYGNKIFNERTKTKKQNHANQ